MNYVTVKIKSEEGYIPVYKHDGDCCADCFAKLDRDVVIKAKSRTTIPLGLSLDLSEGWKAEILPRSGLAKKDGVFAVPGQIDEGYKGEVGCTLINSSDKDFVVKDKDRVCQIKFEPYYRADFVSVDGLSDSDRGEAGFGSTGV